MLLMVHVNPNLVRIVIISTGDNKTRNLYKFVVLFLNEYEKAGWEIIKKKQKIVDFLQYCNSSIFQIRCCIALPCIPTGSMSVRGKGTHCLCLHVYLGVSCDIYTTDKPYIHCQCTVHNANVDPFVLCCDRQVSEQFWK